MAKEIKTKEVVRTVKEHADSAVKNKITEVGIRTKDEAVRKVQEQFTPENCRQNTQSPETYATDKTEKAAKNVSETVANRTEQTIKKTSQKIKEKRAEKKLSDESMEQVSDEPIVESNNSEQNNRVKEQNHTVKERDASNIKEHKSDAPTEQKTVKNKNTTENPDLKSDKADSSSRKIKQKTPEKTSVKEKEAPTVKGRTPVNEETIKNETKPKTHKKPNIKTRGRQDVKNVKPSEKAPKKIREDAHKIKQTKRSAESAKRTVKAADKSFKTAKKNARAAKKTAENTAKTAKKTEHAVKTTAKATAKAVKATAKAIAEGAKAAVAAGKEAVAAVIAGGPVVIVIVVICLIAAIGGTCFGIFLSNDKTTGSQMQMSQAISQLTSEYYNSLTAMKLQYTYDTIEMRGDTSINWKDVLAIYAVKYTNNSDGFDVVTLDDTKLEYLKKLMKEMNPCTGVVTIKPKPVVNVVTDEHGNKKEVTTYENKKVLTITALHVSARSQADIERFSDTQKKQLNELLSSEYDALWNEIIGSTGEILTPGGSYVGTNIFSWPLSVQGTITSRFGTRTDPISGVTKTHGGTDIAAATGTPILAAADGVVEIAGYNEGGYGFYVKIRHNATYETLYGHCSVLHVKTGQTVKQGQMIAEVGSTGYSTGPHCHFEVIQNGVRVDAMRFYK